MSRLPHLRGGPSRRLAYLLLCVLLGYVSVLLAAGTLPAARGPLLRYWSLFAMAVFATTPPHVLLPDPDRALLQLFNPSPARLLAHALRAWVPVLLLLAGPCLVLAFYDTPSRLGTGLPLKALALLETLPAVLGLGLYSFAVYLAIGPHSQAWQEGREGNWWRRASEHMPLGTSLGVPDGLIPAITTTGRLFAIGVLVVVLGALVRHNLPVATGLPGLLLMGAVGYRLARQRHAFDHTYYSTNAFYGELFSGSDLRVAERPPLPYEALYWVPRRIRPAVWSSLRQLDRRLPLGRLVLLGHLILWVLFLNAAPATAAAYLLLFSAAKNGTVGLLGTESFAPRPFQVTQQSTTAWVFTRMFINLRWTLPLLLSLLIVALFDASFHFADALAWTGLDLVLALLAAALTTYAAEVRYRRHYR